MSEVKSETKSNFPWWPQVSRWSKSNIWSDYAIVKFETIERLYTPRFEISFVNCWEWMPVSQVYSQRTSLDEFFIWIFRCVSKSRASCANCNTGFSWSILISIDIPILIVSVIVPHCSKMLRIIEKYLAISAHLLIFYAPIQERVILYSAVSLLYRRRRRKLEKSLNTPESNLPRHSRPRSNEGKNECRYQA